MGLQTQQNIGILGGSFNPVHLGHLVLAQDALERYELDRVLFVPCAVPAHKCVDDLAEAQHRVAMLDHALTGDPRFDMSVVELGRAGVSYSIDTIRQLSEQASGTRFWFIIGADTLLELYTWKDIYRLLELCEFITFQRPGYQNGLTPEALHLDSPWPEHLLARVTEAHWMEISSSEIRRRVAEGLSIRYLVPFAVEMYIYEHGLYKS